MKKLYYKILLLFLVIFFGLLIFIILVNIYINKIGNNICQEKESQKQVVLVLGARVWRNGQMSDIFRDRVKVAIDLYENKKVSKILVSGDHGSEEYDEVNAAKKYLLENNVKPEDIFLDHAGFDTYDSVYRAKEIFQADSVIIVTQNFHLPRALFIADKIGLEACGASADLRSYIKQDQMDNREVLAKVKAWLDITFKSSPKFLGEPIPVTGIGQDSWD